MRQRRASASLAGGRRSRAPPIRLPTEPARPAGRRRPPRRWRGGCRDAPGQPLRGAPAARGCPTQQTRAGACRCSRAAAMAATGGGRCRGVPRAVRRTGSAPRGRGSRAGPTLRCWRLRACAASGFSASRGEMHARCREFFGAGVLEIARTKITWLAPLVGCTHARESREGGDAVSGNQARVAAGLQNVNRKSQVTRSCSGSASSMLLVRQPPGTRHACPRYHIAHPATSLHTHTIKCIPTPTPTRHITPAPAAAAPPPAAAPATAPPRRPGG